MLDPTQLNNLSNEDISKIVNRNKLDLERYKELVSTILNEVKEKQDNALIKYTNLYDKADIAEKDLLVTSEEIKKAYRNLTKRQLKVIKELAKNIKEVHKKQIPSDKIIRRDEGVIVREIFNPLRSAGLYIPSGKAPYPSTALMLGIPAKVAGVPRLIACTPPARSGDVHPVILVALDIAGVDKIYRVGGAQAIGALAYGTEMIQKVDKIVGPGNIYVSTAKMLVSDSVGIDFFAGPSEIMIYADDTANPDYIAADMISQAEHDTLSVSILITPSEKLAVEVKNKILSKLLNKTRKQIIREALENNGHILIVSNETEAVNFINDFAPEHLEILSYNPKKLLSTIYNAGAISIGEYTPVPVTDYALGANHVLPTSGSATFNSGLTVYDFLKIVHISQLNKRGLQKVKRITHEFASIEGLTAHADSINERFEM